MSAPLSEHGAQTLALLATEWFKASRRLTRLAQLAPPAQAERERAQLACSRMLVEDALTEHGLRLVLPRHRWRGHCARA